MLRQRNALTFVVGLGVWLAVFLSAATAILSFTDQVSAQQSSTESMLSTPTLSAQAGENRVDLSWTAVTGAARYELWGVDQRRRLAAVGRRHADRHNLQSYRTHRGHDLLLLGTRR